MNETLAQAQAKLAEATGASPPPQEDTRGPLRKAADALGAAIGLRKAGPEAMAVQPGQGTQTRTEIIGHPGQPGLGTVGAEQDLFGRNPEDRTSPFGAPPEATSPQQVEAGAEARIDARHRAAQEPGATRRVDIQKGEARTSTDGRDAEQGFYRALVDGDGDGRVREAIEASSVLERMTDTIAKGFGGVERQFAALRAENAELRARLAETETVAKAMAEGTAVLLGHAAEEQERLSKAFEGAAVTPARTPFAGVGLTMFPRPESGSPTGGLTKARVMSGLAKAMDAGELEGQAASAYASRMDLIGPEDLVAQLPEAVKRHIGA